MERRKWEEFRSSGLLWFINTTLHLFGWVIAFDTDKEGNIIDVYPARVKYRGFRESSNTEGYRKLTKHIEENIEFMNEAFAEPYGKIHDSINNSNLSEMVGEVMRKEVTKND